MTLHTSSILCPELGRPAEGENTLTKEADPSGAMYWSRHQRRLKKQGQFAKEAPAMHTASAIGRSPNLISSD